MVWCKLVRRLVRLGNVICNHWLELLLARRELVPIQRDKKKFFISPIIVCRRQLGASYVAERGVSIFGLIPLSDGFSRG